MGRIAAAVGSMLADLTAGYAVYVPAVFLIKGLVAVAASLLLKRFPSLPAAAGGIAELIMLGGYLLFESVFMGYGFAALAALPGNMLQGISGVAAAAVLFPSINNYHSVQRVVFHFGE